MKFFCHFDNLLVALIFVWAQPAELLLMIVNKDTNKNLEDVR